MGATTNAKSLTNAKSVLISPRDGGLLRRAAAGSGGGTGGTGGTDGGATRGENGAGGKEGAVATAGVARGRRLR